MYLNSYCVMVTRDGFIIDFIKPCDLDSALIAYEKACIKHRHNIEIDDMYDEIIKKAPSKYDMNNKKIQKMIKEWQGDTRMIEKSLLLHQMSESTKNISIELFHVSQA